MAQKYCCKACDYVYNPQKGDLEGNISPGLKFADLPENWICPKCGVGKEYFEPVGSEDEE
ncbi:MAG: rubredoxin [Firmicutes bacterium]|nr:rubredoxin [Bacillota bacterium]